MVILKLKHLVRKMSVKVKNKKNIQIKDNIILDKNVDINCKNGSIIIEENCYIKKGAVISAVKNGRVKIGKDFYFNYNSVIACHNEIIIKDGVKIAPNVCIYDHDHNFNENGIYDGFKTSPIIIGNNVWIGTGCTILRGTNIGDNSIIGAGCVIKGDIPSNSLVIQGREIKIIKLEKNYKGRK